MESLGLDFKILIAQIINFGLLLFILKRVLYKPVIDLLDQRRKKIEETLENSKKAEERLIQIEEKQKEILQQAQQRAENEREEMLKLTRLEKQRILQEARDSAAKEAEKGILRIKESEAEATLRIKARVSKKVVDELVKKLTHHPLLDELLK